MALWFTLRVTTSAADSQSIGLCEIQRLDDLDLSDKAAIADAVSDYRVRVDGREARVRHRYGDGAWALVARALAATHPPKAERSPFALAAAVELVAWLASLDDPEQAEARRTVTLTQIGNKAREALSRRWAPAPDEIVGGR